MSVIEPLLPVTYQCEWRLGRRFDIADPWITNGFPGRQASCAAMQPSFRRLRLLSTARMSHPI